VAKTDEKAAHGESVQTLTDNMRQDGWNVKANLNDEGKTKRATSKLTPSSKTTVPSATSTWSREDGTLKRIRRRYLAVQLDFEGTLNQREFLDTVWNSVTQLYGEYGASQTGLVLLDFNESSKSAVIRVSLTTLRQVRAALASITHINGKEAAVHVNAVSGTIKSLQN
jgi:ribonuclease P/MRP protein subunit POP5